MCTQQPQICLEGGWAHWLWLVGSEGGLWNRLFSLGLGCMNMSPKEALSKCGGSQVSLDQAISANRVLKRLVAPGMYMYYFPTRAYTKEKLFSQTLGGEADKAGASFADLAKSQEEKMGFTWEPENIIGPSLGALGAESSVDHSTTMASSASTTPLPLGTSTSPLMALPGDGAGHHTCSKNNGHIE